MPSTCVPLHPHRCFPPHPSKLSSPELIILVQLSLWLKVKACKRTHCPERFCTSVIAENESSPCNMFVPAFLVMLTGQRHFSDCYFCSRTREACVPLPTPLPHGAPSKHCFNLNSKGDARTECHACGILCDPEQLSTSRVASKKDPRPQQ